MEKVLYYVVEKEFANVGFVEECTGYKDITVYEIDNNKPLKIFTVTGRNEESSEDLINQYFEDNDFDVNSFKLIQL